MKLYYHLNLYVICAVCNYVCNYDREIVGNEINNKTPRNLYAYCVNQNCVQYDKRMEIKPIEVEVFEK